MCLQSLQFDLDDDAAAAHMDLERSIRHGNPHRDHFCQSMFLLVALLDASAVKRSPHIPMGVAPECSDVDLGELIAKREAGGGMLNSIANMANSILGVGVYSLPLAHCHG
jgi:sodium-coupled neutral amino acid transporter 11